MAKIDEKKRKRRIIIVAVAIILLLLLTRSCSKNFNWTIGKLFGTSSEHEITEESDDVIILNKNLTFDSKEEEITLNDKDYKISFSYKKINPKEFTCTTSDADVATCYVEDGYVVINPKKVGKISVFVETKTNNKVYKASMKLNVSDITRSLILSSKSGKIVLSKANTKILTYNLHNIDGEVSVLSSDTSVATVKADNGVITILGKKAGNCKITVSVTDKNNNKTYKVVYKLTIVDKVSESGSTGGTTDTTTTKPTTPDTPSTDSGTTPTPSTKPTPSITPSPSPSETPSPSPNPSPSTTPSPSVKPTPTPGETDDPVIEKDANNYLKSIETSKGELTPQFDKNILNYNINVENNISKIDIKVKKDSSKASIKYIYKNKTVKDLNDLALSEGDNKLEIEVTAENNDKKVYTVIINRKEIVSNSLKDLKIDGYTISPEFNKDTTYYTVNVLYNESSISLLYSLEDNKSNVSVTINNKSISDLSNIQLKDGENKLEITVTDKNGSTKTYIISIYRPSRTIEIDNKNHAIYIEELPYNINYRILEDLVEINDYNINDISVNISNFDGTYTVNKGYISIIPNNSDIGKSLKLNMTYNNKTVTTNLTINMNKYYINTPALEYDVTYVNNSGNKNIIINNNLLTGTISKTNITNGFRLTSSNGGYIDVVINNNLITVDYDNENSNNNSIVLKVNALNPGTSSITISGNIFGKEINKYNVKLNIISKYNVVIDANGGFFDAFTDKYTYLVESTDEIDLSEFTALKVDDEENCLFFKLDSFNTNIDGTGTKYEKDSILTNFDKDLTLYVIYTATSSFEQLATNDRLYLTEVDLFHNEEYYEKYNVDKIIYPGAEGAHVMSITNSGISTIKITGINLEEDTLCISDGKCLNIGYIIKSALDVNDPYTYFYGDKNEYKILNKDSNTTHTFGSLTGYHTENNISFDPNLEIEVGETKEISILWKWIEVDDELDTKIGSSVSTLGDTYSLTVSIDFERISNSCTLQ